MENRYEFVIKEYNLIFDNLFLNLFSYIAVEETSPVYRSTIGV